MLGRLMAAATVQFVVFAAWSAGALLLGRSMRKRGWVSESASRAVHLWTVVLLWSPVSLISFWQLPLDGQVPRLVVLQLLMMLWGWFVIARIARLFGFPRDRTGVLTLTTVLSNQGFTLGAFLCYTILRPADEALSYAMAFVVSMQLFMVLIFYPVARRYELAARRQAEPNAVFDDVPIGRLIVGSFLDIRAAPMHMALVGLGLNGGSVAMPGWLSGEGPLMTGLIFAGAAGSYLGIGLRLRMGDIGGHGLDHLVVGCAKFIAMPLGMAATLVGLRWIGQPFTPLVEQVLLISSFMPTAMNSVIICNLFHLNARAASVLWLVNTVVFLVIPLPILLWLFG